MGALDHAMVSPQLWEHLDSATTWNINVSEPPLLRYQNPEFSRADAYASSDHDPVIVDLTLSVTQTKSAVNNPYLVYPNPFDDQICLTQAVPVQHLDVTLFDNLGRQVDQWSIRYSQDLDCQDLNVHPAGVYFLKMKSREHTSTQRLVKK